MAKVKYIMERAGVNRTGIATRYIIDALKEINVLSETHVKNTDIDITENQRFYDIPNEAIKIIDIKLKNHLNSKDEYSSIPRLIYPPLIEDADNV